MQPTRTVVAGAGLRDALAGILQLADVARPRVPHERLAHDRGQLRHRVAAVPEEPRA